MHVTGNTRVAKILTKEANGLARLAQKHLEPGVTNGKNGHGHLGTSGSKIGEGSAEKCILANNREGPCSTHGTWE